MDSSNEGAGEDAGYIENAGPGFDPREQVTTEIPAVDPAAAAGQLPALPQEWEEETFREILEGIGEGLHLFAGVGETDWKMTQADLDRIAPPLTRIANRYEPTLALAPYADPFLVAKGFALYGWRSVLARRAALEEQAEAYEGYAVDQGDGAPAGQESAQQQPPTAQAGGVTLFAHRTRPQQVGDDQ